MFKALFRIGSCFLLLVLLIGLMPQIAHADATIVVNTAVDENTNGQ